MADSSDLLVVLRLQDLLTAPLNAARGQVERFSSTVKGTLDPSLKTASAAQGEFAAAATAATTATNAETASAARLGQTAAGLAAPLAGAASAQRGLGTATAQTSFTLGQSERGFRSSGAAAGGFASQVDTASAAARRFRSEISALQLLSARGVLGTGQGGATALLAAASAQRQLRGEAEATGRVIDVQGDQVAGTTAKVGLFGRQLNALGLGYLRMASSVAIATTTIQSFNRALDFDKELSRVPTLLALTAREADGLRTSLVALSNEFGIDKADLARGFYKAIEEGARNSEEGLRLLTAGARLQAAGLGTVEQGIEAVANSLDAYRSGIEETERVQDLFAATAQLSATPLETLAQKFDDLLPLAAQAGISLRQVSSLFIALRTSGTDAVKTTRLMREAFESGFDTRSLEAIAARGVDARKALEQIPPKLDQVGVAADAAAKRLDSSSASLERLKVRLSNVLDQAVGAQALILFDRLGGEVETLLTSVDGLKAAVGGAEGPFASLFSSAFENANRLLDTLQKIKDEVPGGEDGVLARFFGGGLDNAKRLADALGLIREKQQELAAAPTVPILGAPDAGAEAQLDALIAARRANIEAILRMVDAEEREFQSQERIKAALPGIVLGIVGLTQRWIEFRSAVIGGDVEARTREMFRSFASGAELARLELEEKVRADLEEIRTLEQLSGSSFPNLRRALEQYAVARREQIGADATAQAQEVDVGRRVTELQRSFALGSQAARAAVLAKVEADQREIRAIEELSGRSYPELRRALEQYAIARNAQIDADLRAAQLREQERESVEAQARAAERIAGSFLFLRDAVVQFTAALVDAQSARLSTFSGAFEDEMDKVVDSANSASEAGRFAARGLFGAFADGINAFVTTLGTGKNAFKSFTVAILQGIQQMIARMLALKIASAFLGALGFGGGGGEGLDLGDGGGVGEGLPPRAAGGPVEEGQPYLVGERGPEVLVPERGGRILSHADTVAAARAAFRERAPAEGAGAPVGIARPLARVAASIGLVSALAAQPAADAGQLGRSQLEATRAATPGARVERHTRVVERVRPLILQAARGATPAAFAQALSGAVGRLLRQDGPEAGREREGATGSDTRSRPFPVEPFPIGEDRTGQAEGFGAPFGRLVSAALQGGSEGGREVPFRAFAEGGIATGPTLALFGEKPGVHEAFVPLPGAGRGIPVEFKKDAEAARQNNVEINLVVQSLDPRTAADIIQAQMPAIIKSMTAAIHNGTSRGLNDAIRGVRP